MNEFQGSPRIRTKDGATFVPRCEKCARFVQPDDELVFDGNGQPVLTNAECKRCGRTKMIFEGYFE